MTRILPALAPLHLADPSLGTPFPGGAAPESPSSAVGAYSLFAEIIAAQSDGKNEKTGGTNTGGVRDSADQKKNAPPERRCTHEPADGLAVAALAGSGPVPPNPVARPANASEPDQPLALESDSTTPAENAQAVPRVDGTGLRFRLAAPAIGPVLVQLENTRLGLVGVLTVATESARQVVEGHLPELQQQLQNLGIPVHSLRIVPDDGFRRNSRRALAAEWDDAPPTPAKRPGATAGRLPVGTVDLTA